MLRIKKLLSAIMRFMLFVLLLSCNKDEESNSKGKSDANFTPFEFGTLIDIDGNEYKTIKIGTQTWMAENLRTTRYKDGTPIPNIVDQEEWKNLSTGAYCNYNNNKNLDSIATFGSLYNGYAVETGKLAPQGWHIPSEEEWNILVNYVGGPSIAGGRLKEIGTLHWTYPNLAATNFYGFTALPGGYISGSFFGRNYYTIWYSRTRLSKYLQIYRINFDDSKVLDLATDLKSGCSIRCVKDN